MRALPFILKASAFAGLAFAFAACQPGDVSKTTKTESLSYSFSVNGCETGKKTFSDLNSYCQALVDEQANNYCAQNMRYEMYKQRCDGVSSNQNKSQDLSPSVPAEQSAEQETTPEQQSAEQQTEAPTTPATPTNAAEQAAVAIPSEVALSAYITKLPAIKRINSGERVISTFAGAIAIDSIKPAIDKTLLLESARSVKIEGMGRCELEVKNFTTYSKGHEISFTLMGIDQLKDLGDGSCASQLQIIRTSGFTVDFENVPTSNANTTVVPKVTLKIQRK